MGISISRKNNSYSLSGRNDKPSGTEILFTENATSQAIQICRKRMPIAIVGFIAFYLLIIVYIFKTCLANGVIISGFEEINKEHEKELPSQISRADIVDRNGTIIATSLPTVNLQLAPKPKIKNPEEVAEKLSYIFPELKYEDILKKVSKQKGYKALKLNLSPTQQAEVNNLGIPALEFIDNQARIYPHDNLFSHILGYTDTDNTGISGIEKTMHERLTKSSKSLQLTIDTTIQDSVREELQKAKDKFMAIKATAIVMNANNGEVISMVSLPDYNPNVSKSPDTLFNFATQGVYEAGSVFKTFNTALGLESKKIKVSDRFDTTKPLKLKGITVRDFHPVNHWLNVSEILVESSNIGSAHIAGRVGKEKQREFLVNLGFSERLSDFEIYEKSKPLFPAEKNWHEHTMATVSYGYGISVTPLHIISAFNAIVNGGIYYYPTIVKSSEMPAPRRVISENTSKKMLPLLRDVIMKSSTKHGEVTGYHVIGKTGSAEKLVNGKYSNTNITSFISAFPGNNPQYSLLVILDEPKGLPETHKLRTAGWNAAPTAGNIIKRIAPQLNIQADFDLDAQRQNIKAAFEK